MTAAARETKTAEPKSPSTLDVLLHVVEDTLADDRSNGEALEARRTQLLGFTGIILSLLGSLGANHIHEAQGTLVDLPVIGELGASGSFKAAFMVAVVMLAATAVVALLEVRARREIRDADGNLKHTRWSRTGLANATLDGITGDVQTWTPEEVKRSMIGAAVQLIKEQRQLDGLRETRNRRIAALLCIALAAVAVQATILALSDRPEETPSGRAISN